MKFLLTPAAREEWRRYEAANRRARIAYYAGVHGFACGRPAASTGEPCRRPVDEPNQACAYHCEEGS